MVLPFRTSIREGHEADEGHEEERLLFFTSFIPFMFFMLIYRVPAHGASAGGSCSSAAKGSVESSRRRAPSRLQAIGPVQSGLRVREPHAPAGCPCGTARRLSG